MYFINYSNDSKFKSLFNNGYVKKQKAINMIIFLNCQTLENFVFISLRPPKSHGGTGVHDFAQPLAVSLICDFSAVGRPEVVDVQ